MKSWLSRLLIKLSYWYLQGVTTSWRQEISSLRYAEDRNSWIFICIFIDILLIPYLGKEAFSDSVLLGLSFLWATFLAVSFAYILRHPAMPPQRIPLLKLELPVF